MNPKPVLHFVVRLLVFVIGVLAITGVVYCAGRWIVPLVDGADKAITAAVNPDSYTVGLDEFFRAISDYSVFVILVPLLSWLVAYGLYRLLPNQEKVIAGLLVAEALFVAGLDMAGRIWPNTKYAGANAISVIMVLTAFGGAALLFRRMDGTARGRFARVICLVLLSATVTDWYATNTLKKAVARPRPLNAANAPWNERLRPIPDELLRGKNSFPSGHTSGTAALLTPLFWYVSKRWVRAGLAGWVVLQGISRVYTVTHFPFCCLMGALLGFGIGTLAYFLFRVTNEPVEPESAAALAA